VPPPEPARVSDRAREAQADVVGVPPPVLAPAGGAGGGPPERLLMAQRLRANTFGRYYVTSDCDACGECVTVAPLNFSFTSDGDYCVVFAQPVDEHEHDLMEQLMLACPRHAVHDDGDDL
jgi:ferredoxin